MSNTIATAVSNTLNVELAKGSAVFNNADNSITLRDIGRSPEVGDVISVKGSANNSKEFTIEEIISNDKIVVNKAHAGKAWTEQNKSLFSETVDVEVKLLCKWYLAHVGLGQAWVDVSRLNDTPYINNTNRTILFKARGTKNNEVSDNVIIVDGGLVYKLYNGATAITTFVAAAEITRNSVYKYKFTETSDFVKELR